MSNLAEDPVELAKKAGWRCVFPGPKELFVDLDHEANFAAHLEPGLKLLAENGVPVTVTRVTRSPGGNRHIYLEVQHEALTPLTPEQRIILQACLGSDLRRELLSLLRIAFTTREPTAFFESFFECPEPHA